MHDFVIHLSVSHCIRSRWETCEHYCAVSKKKVGPGGPGLLFFGYSARRRRTDLAVFELCVLTTGPGRVFCVRKNKKKDMT